MPNRKFCTASRELVARDIVRVVSEAIETEPGTYTPNMRVRMRVSARVGPDCFIFPFFKLRSRAAVKRCYRRLRPKVENLHLRWEIQNLPRPAPLLSLNR